MTDLPNLDALEAVARAATPGPWHQGAHYIGAGGEPYDPEAVVGQASILCDAEHIAAFDPPTVRALITRLREAERHNVQLLREAVKREKDEASRKRLELLEAEIAKLEREYADLEEVWSAEKHAGTRRPITLTKADGGASPFGAPAADTAETTEE